MAAKPIDVHRSTPLYEQIVEDVRKKIESGHFSPGQKIPTQRELAEYYGVSLITVKNALAELESSGYISARAGKGTFVTERITKKVNLSNQRAIGVVLMDLKHPYFSMIVHGIEERAYELGFNVLLGSSSRSKEKEENQIDRFRAAGVDGLIIASLSMEYRATEYIQQLHREGFPYIMVSYIHDPDYWYVGSDHELGGFLATEHLIRLGYRSIAYAHMGSHHLLSEVRKNGYYRALMEYNIPFDARLVLQLPSTGSDRFQQGYEYGRAFAAATDRPEAIFCYNDMVALGLIKALQEHGIRVPEDLAIVGYDDSLVARYSSVPLTTIHQPVDRLGALTVEVLQKRIARIDVGNRSILKPTLIVRDSCGSRTKAGVSSRSA
jgi:DNA-binding LacI/PurR family transcriptional regulator